MENYKPLVWVEGIIGAGKTTFAREIAKRLNLRLIEEPVGKGEGQENPYLEKFYVNPKKYAFGMQMFLLHKRYAMQQLAAYEATGVGGFDGACLDRSLSGDRVFAKLHLQEGNIERIDWETYELAYSIMCRSLLPPTLLIFLDVEPETAWERMRSRNRTVEAGVPLDYLVKLRDGYHELIAEAESGLLPWSHSVRVVRITWDVPTCTKEQWDSVAKSIRYTCNARAKATTAHIAVP